MSTPNSTPAGSLGGISYEEKAFADVVSISADGATGTRVFFVDWDQAKEFAVVLTGEKVQDNKPESPNEYTVEPMPYSSKYPNLICTEATIKGLGEPGNSGGYASYPYAIITATYSPRVTNGGFVLAEQEMDIGGEFLEYGEFDLFWKVDDKYVATGEKAQNKKIISETQHTFTENNITTNKKSIIDSMQGKINSVAYHGVAAYRMLYLGASLSRQITTNGFESWKITHKFVERIGASWQLLFNTKTQQYEVVYDKDNVAVSLYEEVDFDGLLEEDRY